MIVNLVRENWLDQTQWLSWHKKKLLYYFLKEGSRYNIVIKSNIKNSITTCQQTDPSLIFLVIVSSRWSQFRWISNLIHPQYWQGILNDHNFSFPTGNLSYYSTKCGSKTNRFYSFMFRRNLFSPIFWLLNL